MLLGFGDDARQPAADPQFGGMVEGQHRQHVTLRVQIPGRHLLGGGAASRQPGGDHSGDHQAGRPDGGRHRGDQCDGPHGRDRQHRSDGDRQYGAYQYVGQFVDVGTHPAGQFAAAQPGHGVHGAVGQCAVELGACAAGGA